MSVKRRFLLWSLKHWAISSFIPAFELSIVVNVLVAVNYGFYSVIFEKVLMTTTLAGLPIVWGAFALFMHSCRKTYTYCVSDNIDWEYYRLFLVKISPQGKVMAMGDIFWKNMAEGWQVVQLIPLKPDYSLEVKGFKVSSQIITEYRNFTITIPVKIIILTDKAFDWQEIIEKIPIRDGVINVDEFVANIFADEVEKSKEWIREKLLERYLNNTRSTKELLDCLRREFQFPQRIFSNFSETEIHLEKLKIETRD